MIIYVSGGERSGKSSWAQRYAEANSKTPVYMATAKIWDDNFKERVERHKKDRDNRWTTLEVQHQLSTHFKSHPLIVIDCVTLWLTNLFGEKGSSKESVFEKAKIEVDQWKQFEGTLVVISNEIGMGLHATSALGRDFVEVQGWTNQLIAQYADEAYFMVSGLPIKTK